MRPRPVPRLRLAACDRPRGPFVACAALHDALEQKGILSSMKAQMQSEVFAVLKDPVRQLAAPTPEHRLAG